MKSLCVVVTGPVGVGKSTFVRTFSGTKVVDTERLATDETSLLKKKTTVAFDLGTRILDQNMTLHLYGTPGQSRFDFMWDMLIRRADAYILLVPTNRSGDFHYAREILSFMNQRVRIPMLIGMTCTARVGICEQENILLTLGYTRTHIRPPIVTVNPRERSSVVEALMVLMAHIILERRSTQQPKLTEQSMARDKPR
ncbi:MAG: ATP/GTP-binding protein [Coleofasciculus sp. Co-bin14]|nr:ATP/GTP-binding protein [Coleofasciculus sp. Co-bin14]